MPQTLLALAAILCFSYYSLGRHRADQFVDRRTTSAEVDLAAVDVARGLMARVERNAFDEEDTGHRGVRTETTTSTLGPDDFEDSPGAFDDVDDWHLSESEAEVPVGMGSIRFNTYVFVRYVEDDEPETRSKNNKPTLTKEITVVVLGQTESASETPTQVMLRRVVTPASVASATPLGS